MRVHCVFLLFSLYFEVHALPRIRRRQLANLRSGDAVVAWQQHRALDGDDDSDEIDSSDDEDSDNNPTGPTPPSGTQVTIAQLQSHNTAASCWIQVNINAYDVTNFANRHPGGARAIQAMCGNDATSTFYGIRDHSTSDLNRAINMGSIVAGAPTPVASPSPNAGGLTMSQVSTHNTNSDCWVVVSGNAYDVTTYAASHPGGPTAIRSKCGQDITSIFFAKGPFHTVAVLRSASFKGALGGSSPVPPPPKPTSAPTLAPVPSPTGTGSGGLTMSQVSAHNTDGDCWVVVSGNAYDVTTYAGSHPGGPTAIRSKCGQDITSIFFAKGPFHTAAVLGSASFKGSLGGSSPVPPPPKPTSAPTLAPVPSPTGTGSGGLTMSQVSAHNTDDDCWVVVSGNAYDVTTYAGSHPGGPTAIRSKCGQDITSIFFAKGPFHTAAVLGSASFKGSLGGSSPVPPPPKPTSAPTLAPVPSPTGTGSGGLTMSQVSAHNTDGDCWVVVSGNAYDVTTYAASHPGGPTAIRSKCGQDITSIFFAKGPFHTAAVLGSASFKGALGGSSPVPPPPKPTSAPTLAPVPSPTGTGSGGLTMSQVSAHNTDGDCWVVVRGNAYDVTTYAGSHPGGPTAIRSKCGQDITSIFFAKGPFHTVAALGAASFKGSLGGSQAVPVPVTPSPVQPPTPLPTRKPTVSPTPLPTGVPSSSPSTGAPSVFPSATPSIMPSEDGICEDHRTGRFFVERLNTTVPCHWLRARPKEQPKFCRPSDPSNAFSLCQETCKACVDTCNDQVDFKFLDANGSTLRNCLWLYLRPHKQEVHCASEDVAEGCMETCGNCPTQAPTTAPCDDVLQGTFLTESEGLQNCTWLAIISVAERNVYCNPEFGSASTMCPETCGSCRDYCEDTAGRTFDYDGSAYDCQWLASHPEMQPEVCYHWNAAWTLCKDTCNHPSCGMPGNPV